ncbi:hypothetical protein FRC09_005033 [Ceratobasidium sp. 395]|nr:hypothetical protein FRC09_005033 [Ceratobasidium sp. 395]
MARLCPTEGAEVVFSLCTKAWEHLEQQGNQDTELTELVKQLARMIPSIESVTSLADNNLKETLMDMLNLIEDVSLFILGTRPRGPFERALRAAASSEEQSRAYIAKFKELRTEFDLRMSAQVLRAVEIEKRNAKLRDLKPADLAGYDPNRKCLASTRTVIIDELVHWAQSLDAGPRLAWVHGLAGLGKSSIATSVCLQLDGQRALASSFFCKRDSPELREPRRVLTTIVHGLALRWEAYRDAVVDIIAEDPELHSKHIQPLYESLVSKPLQDLVGVKRPTNTLVVVVDALDECGDAITRKQLLACLRGMLQLEPWLKFIVTSRPNQDIRDFFGYTGADWYTEYNVLNYDALDDVRVLIESRLGELTRASDLSADAAEQLSVRSNGLFIWAQTACQFILDGFDQTKRLNPVLAGIHISNSSADLDILYTTAVKTSALDGADDNMEYTTKCLGVVVATATHTPLSASSLAQLLHGRIPQNILNRVLCSLSSVLYMGQKQGGVVRISHPSFMDYITDPSRSKELCVDLERQNTILAECCLRIMNEGLKFNICGLETSYLLNSQVLDLDSRVQDAIRPHLSYSCLYWSSHVAGAQIGALNDCLRQFLLQTSLVYWIEALSLLGRLKIALSSLLQFTGCIMPDDMQDCRAIANDAYRFVLSFYDAISRSTPHLYISALAFAPRNSGVAQRMRAVFPKLLAVIQGTEKEWTPCLRSIWVASAVLSVAISSDGRRVVSGSEDGTVRIWDAETGDTVLGPLKGHSYRVNCVAFSPDCHWIASGSNDDTIHVRGTETGELKLDPLQGHSDDITSIAFSPDGHRLVSGSEDKTLRIWELETGQSVLELHGHRSRVWSVAFSPSGFWVASGSNDETLRIWDAQTGKSMHEPLCGHSGSVRSVAFSPDGHRIASGSEDSTIRIWDTRTGEMLLGPLQGHSDWIESVAFSLDGHRIASGSDDKTLRIWDAQTGYPAAQPLDSHSDHITSVVFCPNGQVVSSSLDNTIRIWDVADRDEVDLASQSNTSKSYSGWINSVVFSPDGRSVVSGSSNKTVRIWDAETGKLVRDPLRGHTDAVLAVAISSNGRWITSGSVDKTVLIWDVDTGNAALEPLYGHSGPVRSVAFSPDCRLIVSGSDDRTVRVWDVETGQAVLEPLISHSQGIMSVVFSPDGHKIVSGSSDGSVCVWDSRTDQVTAKTQEIVDFDSVESVAFSPDGRRVVSGSVHATLSILDAETCDIIIGPLKGHGDPIRSVAFSPDGCWIASISNDQIIRIWNAQTGKLASEPLQGHTCYAVSIAFSPDGRRIVSGSYDLSIRVWDIETHTSLNVTTPNLLSGELLIWLLPELRETDDSLLCMFLTRVRLPVVVDFTDFVHGSSWSSICDA